MIALRARSIIPLCLLFVAACGGDDGTGGSTDEADASMSVDATAEPDSAPEPQMVRVIGTIGGLQQDLEWLAVQVDDGPYEELAGGGGIYEFEATTRYSVMWHCAETSQIFGMHATVAELPDFIAPCEGMPETFTVSGTLTGTDGGRVRVNGRNSGTVTTDGTYEIIDVVEGVHDVVAALGPAEGAEAIMIDHGHSVTSDRNVNFDFADASPTTTHTAEAGGAQVEASLWTTLGTMMPLGVDGTTYAAPPAALLEGNDAVLVSARDSNVANGTTVIAYRAIDAGRNLDLVFPPPLDSAIASVPATSPYVRFRFAFEAQDEPTGYAFQGAGGTAGFVHFVTAGWQGSATSFELPELSEASGWMNAWALPEGEEASWGAYVMRSSAGSYEDALALLLYLRPAQNWDDLTMSASFRRGALVP